jgi:quercetin dioxygenase-like cupin family protein
MRALLLIAFAFGITPLRAAAQDNAAARDSQAILVQPDQVTWSPAPAVLPRGAKAALLDGDPKAEGPFTMRISMPDGYRVAPHFHAARERVTVLKGTFQVGMGDRFDQAALKSLPAGSYSSMAAGVHHFVRAKGATIIQINGVGPWKLTYVNSADDPRRPTP